MIPRISSPMTVSAKTIFPSSNCHIHKSNIPQNATTACKREQTTKSYFRCAPGSVYSLLLHPLPLKFLPPTCHNLLQNMSLMGPKESLYSSAQQDLVSATYIKMKDNDRTQFTLFVNYCSLAPDITINVSVRQVFEENGSLNFIYLFQSPETITVVPLSL